MEDGDKDGALKLAKNLKGPFKDMFTAGISKCTEGKKMVDEAMYEELLATQPKIRKLSSRYTSYSCNSTLNGATWNRYRNDQTFKQITLFGTGDAKSLSEGISKHLLLLNWDLSPLSLRSFSTQFCHENRKPYLLRWNAYHPSF